MPSPDLDPAAPIDRPPEGILAVPIRSFEFAKGRMAGQLSPSRRAALMRAVAGRVLTAAAGTGAEYVVVTGDREVAAWASGLGAGVLPEPDSGGLDAAAASAAARARSRGLPWCIAHGDLPLITSGHLADALRSVSSGEAAISPSRTGGTNIFASLSPVQFRYGPGSFRRHLAALRGAPARILVSVATALDLDTVADLRGASSLPNGAWLREFLG